jgi:hypothetical protein
MFDGDSEWRQKYRHKTISLSVSSLISLTKLKEISNGNYQFIICHYFSGVALSTILL